MKDMILLAKILGIITVFEICVFRQLSYSSYLWAIWGIYTVIRYEK